MLEMALELSSDLFFNRERELAQLEAAWTAEGGRPQLVTLWGRRRVGKSALLSHFSNGKAAVYLYGTRVAERDILAGLAAQVADLLDDPYLRVAPFPDWPAVLQYLERAVTSNRRLLLVFDEFPYLCEMTAGLDTLVQAWWDRVHEQSSASFMLVLAGSAFSFMQGLTGATGPLHGRRTAQVEVHPFDYFDSARFFPHLQADDRIRAYACFGGIPAYLRHWEPRRRLDEMVQATFLSPGHFLFREAEELLRTEFHQEAMYASILRAVAAGQERPSDIARALGRGGVNDILDQLRRLQELQFLQREVPVTEWEQVRSQRVLYRLADPYLRFWFHYVAPHQSLIQLGRGAHVWERDVAPHLDEFVARTTWEEVCHQFLWRRLAGGELPVSFAQLGRWWDGKDEIDLVGLERGRATLIGECKWSNSEVDERVFVGLQRKAEALPLAERPLWVLASRSGFDAVLRQRAQHGDLMLLTPDDLFA